MATLFQRDRQSVWHPFTPFKSADEIIPLTHAKGAYLYTEDGRKILDAISSWWVNIHGHSHPYIAEAIAKQAHTLEHVIFAGFTHEPAVRLAERLLQILPSNQAKIFYSDNGSTATEVAIKMALQYFWNLGQPRKRLIAIEGAYHGDTFGAMSVGDRGPFTEPFFQQLFEVDFLPFPEKGKEAELKNQLAIYLATGEVAAFIFEPLVQGAAGMRLYEPAILDELISMVQASGALCIADEVMTGFGRTGKLFASDYLTTQPDFLCLSKGLTGGVMALGVTSCAEKVVSAFQTTSFLKTFFHGHSFTANPMACEAANASLDLLLSQETSAQLALIARCHKAFAAKAAQLPLATNVRQLGTILALDLSTYEYTSYVNEARGFLYRAFLNRNILIRPLGNVIYVLPPYCITEEELQQVYAAIISIFEQVAKGSN